MPDFARPEFASYIQFCREHPQKREFRDGDWFWWPGGGSGIPYAIDRWDEGVYCYHTTAEDEGDAPDLRRMADFVFLPPLDYWLDMLEAIDALPVRLGVYDETGERFLEVEHPSRHATLDGYGRSYEEAAARLCMAITGSANPQK